MVQSTTHVQGSLNWNPHQHAGKPLVSRQEVGVRDLELVLIDSVSVYCQCMCTVIMQSYDLVTSVG